MTKYYISRKDWFSVKQVNPIVTAIREPYHVEDNLSFQIHGENGESILIDTGMGLADISKVLTNPDNIQKIFLTHAHNDHIGGVTSIKPEKEVHVFNHDFEVSTLKNGLKPGIDYVALQNSEFDPKFLPEQDISKFEILPINNFKTFEDEEEIHFDKFRFIVIHTPGHTPGSVAFWEPDQGFLFAGDAIYNGPIFLHLPESNFEDYKSSVNKIKKVTKDRIKYIFPAHNHFVLAPDFLNISADAVNNLNSAREIRKGQDGYGKYKEYKFSDRLSLVIAT